MSRRTGLGKPCGLELHHFFSTSTIEGWIGPRARCKESQLQRHYVNPHILGFMTVLYTEQAETTFIHFVITSTVILFIRPFTTSKERHPKLFGQITECVIVTKGGIAIIWELHAFVCVGWSRGTTARYNCFLRGKLTSSDTVTEMLGNWDLMKLWPCSLYRNARNYHLVESGKTHFGAVSVVILEGSNGSRDDRRYRVPQPGGAIVTVQLNEEEDHWLALVTKKTYIRNCFAIVIPAYR